ncbi:hypothetical protein B0I37DRAFT_356238 [Chaetomium sp. MPI-CAGE-AT-0009]|nr:hypothetical protein B0I37DRAFT_356238 [Chaetomium sp. MPI-CAGE-AT-0009]
MDPLSITAGAVALAAHVLRSAAFVKEAVDQFRDAPALACDIEHEIKIVQAALRQVEAALHRDPQAIGRLSLDDVFELSVEGCRDTLREITQEFETLFGRRDWRVRLAVWWNSGDIRRLLGRLETKKGSLMLLVQALSLLGLDAMVPSYPAYTAKDMDSTASGIDSGDSMLGDRDSVVSNTRFIFDDICFDSKPYRHTVARVSAKEQFHHKKGEASATPSSPALPTAEEAKADTHNAMLRETEPPIQPAGVTPEEHEAVVRKLREAEALIRTLQGHSMEHRGGPNPGGGVERSTEVDEGADRVPYIVPETPATNKSRRRRRTTRRAEGARDLLPERSAVQHRPESATKSGTKASSAVNQPSALLNRLPVAAESTRGPTRSRATPSQREIELLTEYFKETKEEENCPKPSIKVHFTPSDEGKSQRMIVTNLYNGTTQTLHADTGREITSSLTPATQTGNALLSQTRARSAIARTTNPIFGYRTPGTANSGPRKSGEARCSAGITTHMTESWSTLGQVHSSRTISTRNQLPSHDLEAVQARIGPGSDILNLQSAPHKSGMEHNADQVTPEVSERNEVFRPILAPARPNPPLLLPVENGSQGSDISNTEQENERAITSQRPYRSDNPRPPGMDVERIISKIMDNTSHSVDVLAVPTGGGTLAYPESGGSSQARLAKENEKVKKKSVFLRALKGLGRPSGEFATVEKILGELLVQVKDLQSQVQQDKENVVLEAQ